MKFVNGVQILATIQLFVVIILMLMLMLILILVLVLVLVLVLILILVLRMSSWPDKKYPADCTNSLKKNPKPI